MASPIKLHLSHSNIKYEIDINGDQPMEKLMEKCEELTEVPKENMKILAMGKTISNNPDQPILASGLKNGSKIMMLGKKVNSAEDSIIANLKPIRKDFDTKVAKLEQVAESVENYEKGFVQEKKPIDKLILGITEFFMKLLEKLDGLSIGQEHKVAREKRKSLVKDIQKQLDRCDVLRSRLTFTPTGKLTE